MDDEWNDGFFSLRRVLSILRHNGMSCKLRPWKSSHAAQGGLLLAALGERYFNIAQGRNYLNPINIKLFPPVSLLMFRIVRAFVVLTSFFSASAVYTSVIYAPEAPAEVKH